MKPKDNFILTEVGGEWIAVPVGERAKDFHGVVRLNESGAFIWKALAAGREPKQIEESLMAEYEGLDAETAHKAVAFVLEKLAAAEILEE